MTEDVVKDVGLLQVVELVGLAHEGPGREAAVGQVLEEHLVGDQAWRGDHGPAGQPLKLGIDRPKVGDAAAMQVQRIQPLQEGVAGAAGQQGGLTLIERVPHPMLIGGVGVPVLVDGPVRACARGRELRCRAHTRKDRSTGKKVSFEIIPKIGTSRENLSPEAVRA